MSTELFTKSRFKLGCEYPTKLYFTSGTEYGSTNADSAFLKALAEVDFKSANWLKFTIKTALRS